MGNTCFFNSVLQCLAQTPFLIEILLEISEPGQKAVLPIDDNTQLVSCCIEFHYFSFLVDYKSSLFVSQTMDLENWGKVTEALAITLRQLTEVSGNAFNPITLLNHLREKYRQFKGYNQHDAHELLRQLLDSVKTEDIRVGFFSHVIL